MATFNANNYQYIAEKIHGLEKRKDMYKVFSQNEEICRELNDAILSEVFDGKYNMAYQPHINSEEICTGAEALFRLKIGDTFVNPMLVFALAGYYGEECRLTLETLDRVCTESKEFIENITPDFVTTFNVDPDIFCDFCDGYKAILKRHNMDPHSIGVEITEGSLLSNEVKEKMKELHEDGTNILIDDFGQGEQRDIDDHAQYYKIPKETVDNIENDELKRRHFIDECKDLKEHGEKIIAEGVENEEQNKIVQKYVDYVQGYFYSKPIDKDTFLNKYAITNKNQGIEI